MDSKESGNAPDTEALNRLTSLRDRARLKCIQGDYGDAARLYLQVLKDHEAMVGAEHEEIIQSVHQLAVVYRIQGCLDKAEVLFCQAIYLSEKFYGLNDICITNHLNYLAGLYNATGNYIMAEIHVQRSLAIYQEVLGPRHNNVAMSLMALALLAQRQKKTSQAQSYYKQSVAITRYNLSLIDQTDVPTALASLAQALFDQKQYEEAELVFRHSLIMAEELLWPGNPFVGDALRYLAGSFASQGRHMQAVPLYRKALAVIEQVRGPQHGDIAQLLDEFAKTLRFLNQDQEAKRFENRAQFIRASKTE